MRDGSPVQQYWPRVKTVKVRIDLPAGVAFDVDDFLEKGQETGSEKQSIVIAVSEGIKTADGRYVCELSAPSDKTDSFSVMYSYPVRANICLT